MPAPYYRFDGSNDFIEIADSPHLSFGDGTSDSPFSISAWINIEDVSNGFYIINKGIVGSSTHEYLLYLPSGKLTFYAYDQSAGSYIGRQYDNVLTSFDGSWIHVAATYSGSGANSGIKLYLNGVQVDDTNFSSGSYTAMEADTAAVTLGRYDTSYDEGSMADFKIHNLELSTAEVKELYSGASVPFKYKGANQTELTSGTLTIGKKYRINDWITNDDFTNIGGTNEDGNEFVATGTTPTTWTNSSTVVPIGAVAEYDGSTAGAHQWGDKSGNALHGTVGAGTGDATAPTLENTPYDSGTEYEEGYHTATLTCSGSGTLTVHSSNDQLSYIRIGNQVTVNGLIATSAISSPVGYFSISLPYVISDRTETSGRFSGSITIYDQASSNISDFVILGIEGESAARVYLGDDPSLQSDSANAIDAATNIAVSVTYFV
jgi:hypothetical protein